MEYRNLGRTREKIPVIGMGTWKIGAPRGSTERSEQVSSLRRGIELGMNLIDTAEFYGDGESERLVGEAIEGRRDSVFIATKVWPNHLHYDDVIDSCNGSLERLGIKQIDLYQVHWPNPRVPIRETMSAMERLAREGRVRHVGVSNFSVAQMREAQDALTKSELASNQVEYSITHRSIEADILPYCEKEGMTVMAYSPLGQGSFPASSVPRAIIDRYHMTPAQAILNWVTFRKSVVAIPKSADRRHTEENAASVSARLSEEDYRLMSGQSL